jgi:hypothetical protein
VCGDEKKCMMVNCQKSCKSSDCFLFECAEPNWGYCCIRRVCEDALPVSVLSLSLHVFVSLSQCDTAHYTKCTFLDTQTSQPGDPSLDPASEALTSPNSSGCTYLTLEYLAEHFNYDDPL